MRTLFKGGTIYDGTGRRPFAGDVLIEDDRIVKVAESIEDKDGFYSIFTKEADDGEHMFKICTVNPETGKFENFELLENKKYGKYGKKHLW